MKIIDTKAIAQNNLKIIKQKILDRNLNPKLAIILASNDEPSKRYVDLKIKKANEVGIQTELFSFGESVSFEELKDLIEKLNQDKNINGIFLQLPQFPNLKERESEIINLVDSKKDVDGLTAINQGKISQGVKDGILPATVMAILKCLIMNSSPGRGEGEGSLENIQGKNILIINNSNLVGKPLAQILTAKNATVTLANKYTKDLTNLIQMADIIVSATGHGHLIKASDLKDGTIFIDVTSILKNGKVIGDLEVDDQNKDITITPVPGGIGPITITCLLENLLICCE